MPRLRSVAVVALLWMAAFAGSSAPDGFSGPGLAETPLVAGTAARAALASRIDGIRTGKRWALLHDEGGKRWALLHDEGGKRWA